LSQVVDSAECQMADCHRHYDWLLAMSAAAFGSMIWTCILKVVFATVRQTFITSSLDTEKKKIGLKPRILLPLKTKYRHETLE
jgi:hypothetical protein